MTVSREGKMPMTELSRPTQSFPITTYDCSANPPIFAQLTTTSKPPSNRRAFTTSLAEV